MHALEGDPELSPPGEVRLFRQPDGPVWLYILARLLELGSAPD